MNMLIYIIIDIINDTKLSIRHISSIIITIINIVNKFYYIYNKFYLLIFTETVLKIKKIFIF